MNTARDEIREDMHKRPDQLQREADDVRADMEHTVDELANQFSPGELINQAMGMFRGDGDAHFVRNLSTQIQNNPVPAILAGVGLTWLMTASKQPPANNAHSGNSHPMQSAGDKLSSTADQARSSAQHITQGARDKQQHLAQGASDMKQRVSDGGHQVMDSARTGVRSARNRYDTMLQEQPLMLGAMAIAVGAALGALMPRTETVDRTMGEISDEQKQAVKHRADEMKEKAESRVEEKLDEQRTQMGSSDSQGGTTPGVAAGTSTGASPSYSNPAADEHRRDASSPSAHSQGQAPGLKVNSPAAGAAGPPGSEASAGSGKEGVPVANPSSVPDHPDTNPPILNDRDGRQS